MKTSRVGWLEKAKQLRTTELFCEDFESLGFNLSGVLKNDLEPQGQPFIYKWLFQLDDEPNLYIGNVCFTKHPF